MPTVEFRNVSHRFGEKTVLDNISITLSEQRVGIVGANGSGKSTFARMMNGLVKADEGDVIVNGVDVASDAKTVRRTVGFIFTNPDSQIVMPTVGEDVAFTLRNRGLSKTDITERVSIALERFNLSSLRDSPAHLLSGGQKQLLALAAVLVAEPSIVIADEPTTLLDARNAERVRTLFRALPQQLIVVTHQLELVDDFDRVLVIDNGRIVADDSPGLALAAYRLLLKAPESHQ